MCAINLIWCLQCLIQAWKKYTHLEFLNYVLIRRAIWTIIFVSVLRISLDILYTNTDVYNLATRYKRNLNGHVVFLLYRLTVSRRKTGKPQGSPISHFSFNETIAWVLNCSLSVPGILSQYGTNSLVSSSTAYL